MGNSGNSIGRNIQSRKTSSSSSWQPSGVHVQKTNEAYLISIDVPGVKHEDMQMQLVDKNETLVLSGVRKFHSTTGEEEHVNEEAKFEKRFAIGSDVDAKKITADLSDGVLKITAPKMEAPSPLAIPIKVGQNISS